MHWPSVTQISHIEGMITLLGLRGGINGMNTNKHVKRVVAWADILHAAAHNSLPRFGITQYTAHCERQGLKEALQQHRYSYSSMAGQNAMPTYFREVMDDLQTLTMAKSLLMKKTVSNQWELRAMFSSLLSMTEHGILKLGHTMALCESVTGDLSYVEAVKAAALIFSFHGLRDMTLGAAFFDKLIRRLRDGLCTIFHDFSQHQNPGYMSDKTVPVPFLLWLCLTGWKASAIKTRATDRRFFVDKAARLCESARIDTLEKLNSHICRIAFMTEHYIAACGGLWAEINTWTASRDIGWMW